LYFAVNAFRTAMPAAAVLLALLVLAGQTPRRAEAEVVRGSRAVAAA
jgi:hypothetical protein